jgi:hypothetical protein
MVSSYCLLVLMMMQRLYVPTLSRMAEHPKELAPFVINVLKLTNATSAPIACLILALIHPITVHVFGPEWLQALPAFYLFWSANLVVPTVTPLMSLLQVLDRGRLVLGFTVMWMLLTWALGVPAIVAFGVTGAGLANCLVQLSNYFVFRAVRRHLRLAILPHVLPIWAAAALSALTVYFVEAMSPAKNTPQVLSYLLLGGALYCALLVLFCRNDVAAGISLFWRRAKPQRDEVRVAFAFEYLLPGYSRKDVVQVPATLAELLDGEWCYLTRPSAYSEEIIGRGTAWFVGGPHSARNRRLLDEGHTTAASFSQGFAVLAAWKAAGVSDFYMSMFLDGRSVMAATAYRLGRFLSGKGRFVYLKADWSREAREQFERRAHGNWLERLRHELIHRWLSLVADVVSVETTDDAQWLAKNFYRLKRILVVRNCAVSVRNRAVTSERLNRIMTVSRLSDPVKGTDILLPAFRQFHAAFPNWQLLLVGQGDSELQKLLAPYQDLLESGHIQCEGFVSGARRLSELYQSAAIFVQPSRREGSPLAIIEAVREGCLPICTPVFPVTELLGELTNDLTVPVNDVAALTRCMSNLASAGPTRWDKMRKSLMSRTADWEWDTQLRPVVNAYLEETQDAKVRLSSR